MKILFSSEIRSHADDIAMACMDGIGHFISHIQQVNKSTVIECPVTITSDVDPLKMLGDIFDFLHFQYVAKFFELSSNMVLAANRSDYLVFALCGRSIIEATATLRYYNKKCHEQILVAAKAEDVDTKKLAKALEDLHVILDEHLRGGQFNWFKFFTGDKKKFTLELVEAARSKKKLEQPNPESPKIGNSLYNWEKEEPSVRLAYCFFCELVHPNLGSNFLLMGVDHGRVLIGGNTNKSVGRQLCLEGIKFVAPTLRVATEQLAASRLLGALGKPING